MTEIEDLRKAISALEAQRAALGDAVVEIALAPLREKLAALQAQGEPPDQQRRLVSVLFADISRSTELSQGLEPDEVLALMDGALRLLAGPVEENGGRVSRYMGDGLMAVFGLPTSRENDAARAVRAGLGMLEVARGYAQELERGRQIRGLTLRVGISTGLVATGGASEAENTVMGLPVNLGARLESAAPPGGLLISLSTYQQVRGAFEIEPQEPIWAKGFPEPIPAFLVRSARPRTFRTFIRTVHGVETRMVGREVEFWQLRRAFEAAVSQAHTHLITVIGEAGIGKSRLLYEFDRWRAAQPSPALPFKARASLQTSGTPFSLMRELLAYRFGILSSDPAPVTRQKLEAGLAGFLADEPQMKAHLIAALLGYDLSASPHLGGVQDDSQQLRERALFYLGEFFAAAADQAPTVIMVDDIHWADGPSLEALIQIVRERPTLRLAVVCLARTTLLESRGDWAQAPSLGKAGHVQVSLEPLPREASYQLLREILHKVESLPETLLETVVSAAEGNPFYTEELIEMLLDDGVIRRDEATGSWHLDRSRLDRLEVPSTLMAVLQARLDGLPLAERVVLQQASVVGRVFWTAALQALQGLDEPPVRELATLCRRDLIDLQDRSTFAGTDEYQFKHALMRDAAYNTVLVRTRRAYHGLAAGWLAEATATSGQSDEVAGVIAEHYEEAGEPAEAAAWYVQAGERAKAKGAPAEARVFLDRALALLPPADRERRWRALLARDEVLGTLGEIEARQIDDAALVALALELEDDGKLAEAYRHQGHSLSNIGRYPEALESLDRALAAARRAGDARVETLVLGWRVVCLTRLGEKDRARPIAEEALARAQEVGEERILVRNLTNVSLFYSEYGDLGRAAQLLEEQVAINRRLANRLGEAVGLSNLGYDYVQLGLYVRAIDVLERAVELSLAIGHRLHCAYSRLNLALAHLRNGDLADATRALAPALPALAALNDRFGQAVGQSYGALAQAAAGQPAQALEEFAQAQTTLAQIGVLGHAHDAAAGSVRCLLALDRTAEARQPGEALWDYLANHGAGGMEFPVLAYLTCADLFAALGDAERSRSAVERGYHELLERAEKIGDPAWRFSYLEKVPEHRTITERWKGE